MELPEQAREAFALDLAAKFMATVNSEGEPNIAPIITTYPWKKDQLVFGDFIMRKTKENLLLRANAPVSVAVMTEKFQTFEVQGRFEGFETKGEKFNFINGKDLFRYSAIGLLRSAGTITIEKVHPLSMGTLGIAMDWLTTKIATHKPKEVAPGELIHPVIRKKVGILRGAKFLAVSRGEYAEQVPVMGLQPAGDDYVVFRTKMFPERQKSLALGEKIAISVFTMDPQAYQLKGEFMGYRRSRGIELGFVRITSVWTQVLPRPGERITYTVQ